MKITPKEGLKRFVVKIEINHSTDFNEFDPASAREGDANYSGGKMGSGQPAVVYATTVDLSSGQHEFPAALIGHSSPDGSDGLCRSGNLSDAHLGITHRQGDRHPHPAMKKLLHLLFCAGLSCTIPQAHRNNPAHLLRDRLPARTSRGKRPWAPPLHSTVPQALRCCGRYPATTTSTAAGPSAPEPGSPSMKKHCCHCLEA